MVTITDEELREIVHRVVQHNLADVGVIPKAMALPASADTTTSDGLLATPQASSEHTPPLTMPRAAQKIAIGADHGGYLLKEAIKKSLVEWGYPVTDCGTHDQNPVDYPDYAQAVAKLVSSGEAWRGIIIDGAGIGSCMAANKVRGVRAAMCYDHATAVNSREHNDANVLTLGGGLIGENLAKQIVKTWLTTDFAGGRHARRVDKIMAIESQYLTKR